MGLICEDGSVLKTNKFWHYKNTSQFNIFSSYLDEFLLLAKDLLASEENSDGAKIEPSAIAISGNGPSLIADLGEKKTFSFLWNEKVPDIQVSKQGQTQAQAKVMSADEISICKNSMFLPRLLYFKSVYPEIFSSAQFISSAPEFFVHALTNCKPFTLLPEIRFKNAYWTEEQLAQLEKFGMKNINLPPFTTLGSQSGFLAKEFLTEMGLSGTAKIPVFCSGPDFVAALIGTNTLEEGKICDRMGSSEGINLCTKDVAALNGASDSTPNTIRTMPSVVEGLWNKSVIIEKSGSLISNEKINSRWKAAPYDSYFKMILTKSPHHYKNDEKVVEDTYKSFEKLLEKIQSAYKTLGITNCPEHEHPIICTGQQAKSDDWLQFRANYLQKTLARTTCPESELIGNAIVALATLNTTNDIQNAAEIKKIAAQVVKLDATFEPKIL